MPRSPGVAAPEYQPARSARVAGGTLTQPFPSSPTGVRGASMPAVGTDTRRGAERGSGSGAGGSAAEACRAADAADAAGSGDPRDPAGPRGTAEAADGDGWGGPPYGPPLPLPTRNTPNSRTHRTVHQGPRFEGGGDMGSVPLTRPRSNGAA
ncbi:hypothetical protein GCM10010271_69590 [Streptomyces kurssanovii]|nr:hypothetical protein GCM10010271_69590 [Streptomyces kurssanovii]